MLKQAVANGFGIQISADAGNGVVVELEKYRTEIVDQTINGTRNMLARFGERKSSKYRPESHTRTP